MFFLLLLHKWFYKSDIPPLGHKYLSNDLAILKTFGDNVIELHSILNRLTINGTTERTEDPTYANYRCIYLCVRIYI